MDLAPLITFYKRQKNLLRFRYFYKGAAPVDFDRMGEFRSEAFPDQTKSCWLDRPDAEALIAKRLRRKQITEAEADACRFWRENGYLVLSNLIPEAELDAAWAAYEKALEDGVLGARKYVDGSTTLIDRTLDAHLQVPEIRALQHHPNVLRWTDLLFGRKTIPFQTIIGHAGSEQKAHSDSIHMTTYPLGFLVANWLAFEDISPDSGPLEYYAGSHRLPYIFSSEVGIPKHEFKHKGYEIYAERYEPVIAQACETAGLEKKTFLAKKGDILFWHANLVHGGSPRLDPQVSRKALVCHYFAEGVFTYHDLSGNASRLHKNGRYARPVV